jgi:peptidylprolyl isomerase
MKSSILILFLVSATAACAMAASAQSAAKPAATSTTAKPATTTAAHSAAPGVKLPPGIPVVRGVRKTAFTLQYQDIKIGAGAEAEPNKLYKVQYTGWLAADGHKFDSSYDHPRPPVLDKDGKPVLDADGKPKQGDPQPFAFAQGFGRLIPGFDDGFYGMKVGGKRRLFIPWQLAYGAKGHPGPDAAHPGIPPKADLIFDVELVDVTDLPQPANHPGMGGMPGGHPMPGAPPRPGAGNGIAPASPGQPAAPAIPPAPSPTPAQPAPSTTPPATTAPAPPAPTTPPPSAAPQTPAPPQPQ